jgi:hypothetical protein
MVTMNEVAGEGCDGPWLQLEHVHGSQVPMDSRVNLKAQACQVHKANAKQEKRKSDAQTPAPKAPAHPGGTGAGGVLKKRFVTAAYGASVKAVNLQQANGREHATQYGRREPVRQGYGDKIHRVFLSRTSRAGSY